MPRLIWDQTSEKLYETGVDRVVLYNIKDGIYGKGVNWNGVTNITENKSGAEATDLYANNHKYLSLYSLEEYGLTIECYTYPDEFKRCNGISEIAPGVDFGQQGRERFGLSFRTLIGNDITGDNYGYKLHLVYGCYASPSEEANSTINDSPEAKTLSYEVSTTAVPVENAKNTSCITIDSTKVDKEKLKALEDILYGTDETSGVEGGAGTEGTDASLPLPDAVAALFAQG